MTALVARSSTRNLALGRDSLTIPSTFDGENEGKSVRNPGEENWTCVAGWSFMERTSITSDSLFFLAHNAVEDDCC